MFYSTCFSPESLRLLVFVFESLLSHGAGYITDEKQVLKAEETKTKMKAQR